MQRKNTPGCACCGSVPTTCVATCGACQSGKLPSILYVTDANGTWTCGLKSYFDSEGIRQKEWVGYAFGNVSRKVTYGVGIFDCSEAKAGKLLYAYQIRCVTIEDTVYLQVKRLWFIVAPGFIPCHPVSYADITVPIDESIVLPGESTANIESIDNCADFDVDATLIPDSGANPDPFGASISIRPETNLPDLPYCCGRIRVVGCHGFQLYPFFGSAQVKLYDRQGGAILSSGAIDGSATAYMMWPHRSSYWVEITSPSDRFQPIAQTITLEGGEAFWERRCGGGIDEPADVATLQYQPTSGYACATGIFGIFLGCAYPLKKTLRMTTAKGDVTLIYDETHQNWMGGLEFPGDVVTGFTYSRFISCICNGYVKEAGNLNLWFIFCGNNSVVYKYGSVQIVNGPIGLPVDNFVRFNGTYPTFSAECPPIEADCLCGVNCGVGTESPEQDSWKIVCIKPDEDIALYIEQQFFEAGDVPVDGTFTITE